MARLPNFLLISGGRSGSSSLHNYLSQHPQVFMPANKEPYFLTGIDFHAHSHVPSYFERELWVRDAEQYAALFQPATSEVALGEASVSYLYYHRETIPNIKQRLGDPKIVILLRDPVERAYSHYLINVQQESEPLSFPDALAQEDQRVRDGWWWGFHYRKASYYSDAVRAYKAAFSRVEVFLYDDFKRDPAKTARDIFEVLDVAPSFRPDVSHVHNASSVRHGQRWLSRSRVAQRIADAITARLPSGARAMLMKGASRLDGKRRRQLASGFRSDIDELGALLGRDLGAWKRGSDSA